MDNKLSNRSTTPIGYKDYLRKQAKDTLKELPQSNAGVENVRPLIDVNSLPLMQDNPQVSAQSGAMQRQKSIIGGNAGVTQAFGNKNPIEIFSKGINTGTDFGAGVGTSLALPPGKWIAEKTYNGAKGQGHIGDNTNSGYGNSVLFRNADTGEKMRFSHLSQLDINQGDTIDGGNVFGATGATGNVTGPHLDLEYYNQAGQLADIMRSLYAAYLMGGNQ